MIAAGSTRSGYLGLAGVVLCIAVAVATARWAGKDTPGLRQPPPEPATTTAQAEALTEGRIAGPSANESGRPAREEGKPVADPRDPADHWSVPSRRNREETRTGVEPENAGGFEGRELEAHEITLQDIDWFGQHFVEPGARELSAQPETRRERQPLEHDRALELAGVCAGVGDAGCDSLLYESGRPNRVYLPKVGDDTLAFEVGLRAGDEIIRVGEVRIFSVFDLRDALAAQSEGPPIIIEALRDGAPMRFSLPAGARLGTPYGSKTAPPLLE